MRELEPLNTMRFWCKCGLGEKGNCSAYHVPEMSEPGSVTRHYLLIAGIGAVFVAVLMFGLMTNR